MPVRYLISFSRKSNNLSRTKKETQNKKKPSFSMAELSVILVPIPVKAEAYSQYLPASAGLKIYWIQTDLLLKRKNTALITFLHPHFNTCTTKAAGNCTVTYRDASLPATAYQRHDAVSVLWSGCMKMRTAAFLWRSLQHYWVSKLVKVIPMVICETCFALSNCYVWFTGGRMQAMCIYTNAVAD